MSGSWRRSEARNGGEDEQKMLGALIVIFTGVEDVAKLNVPVEVWRRLIQCYDDLRKE